MRHAVKHTPNGSPEAGPVRVYRIDPETGEKVLVREDAPRHAAAQDSPGKTIEQHVGTRWVGRKTEDEEEEE